jgi:predicted butyrate kinase (DUF1464 family)
MRKLLYALVFILAGQSMIAQVSPIQEFMKNYDGGEAATSVYISPSMAEMIVSSVDEGEADEMASLFKDFQGMRILVLDQNVDQAYKSFSSNVNLKGYEELMTVKEDGQVVMILGDPASGGDYKEIAMIVYEKGDELVLMSFIGTLSQDQLKSLNKAFDMDLDEIIEEE